MNQRSPARVPSAADDHPVARRLDPLEVDELAEAADHRGVAGFVAHDRGRVDRAPAVETGLRACPPAFGSGQAGPRRMSGFA
jgi:hypothetical protein